jgi:hypothetical protein
MVRNDVVSELKKRERRIALDIEREGIPLCMEENKRGSHPLA